MNVVESLVVLIVLWIVALVIQSLWMHYARIVRKARMEHARRHVAQLAPIEHLEPFPSTTKNVTLGLAHLLCVEDVSVTQWKNDALVKVDIHLHWWAVLGLGYFHRRARAECAAILQETFPDHVAWEVEKVSTKGGRRD